MESDRAAAAQPAYKDFAHTGPGTLAGRYLRSFWQPVFEARDLIAGRAVPIRIMSEDFTLYRSESGTPHLTAARCPHRGTQLSTGWVEGEAIRCYYHGWKFDGSGQCVEQPPEPESFAHKVRIATYPTEEYLGFIFAYLGEGSAPEFPRFPEFEAEVGIFEWDGYVRRCNYFQNIENALDNAHVGFVHRDIGGSFDGLVDRPTIAVSENEWGIAIKVKRTSGSERQTYIGMPNRFYMYGFSRDPKLSWMKSLFFWVPIDDESHRNFVVRRLPVTGADVPRYNEREAARKRAQVDGHGDLAESVLSGGAHRDDLDLSRTDLPRFQDDLAQVGQGVIADREHERLGNSDAGIILLRKLWARELRALAEGTPLKEWTRSPDMFPPPPREVSV